MHNIKCCNKSVLPTTSCPCHDILVTLLKPTTYKSYAYMIFFFHTGKSRFYIVYMVGLTVIAPKSNSADLKIRETIMKERDFPP